MGKHKMVIIIYINVTNIPQFRSDSWLPVTLAYILTLRNVYHNKHSEDTVNSDSVQRNLCT
jgi:hypothetical protein